MTIIRVRDDESIEEALRRFKRACDREGVLKELKRRRHHLRPSIQKQLKRKEAERKRRRARRRHRSR